jgi:hypothetical protein
MVKAWTFALLAFGLGILTAPVGAAVLAPHIAAYRLDLHGRQGTSNLVDVQGALVIEWRLACDGWLSRQRLGFVATTQDGGGFSHDVRFSSWESTDGSQLQYTIRSYNDEGMQEEYRGEARLQPDGSGVAKFSAPSERDVKLPPGTIFPTEHMRRILAGADQGARFLSHEVFDGWGFDALTQISSVIGQPKQIEPLASGPANDGDGRGWPVSMAYYNLEHRAETPEFEASFLLTEKGVLRDLILDYGDFQLAATLERLELLDRPDC